MGCICLLLPMTARFLFIPAVGTAIGKNALGRGQTVAFHVELDGALPQGSDL
jgi:hypothetical protein